jgi:hypothetical protein
MHCAVSAMISTILLPLKPAAAMACIPAALIKYAKW